MLSPLKYSREPDPFYITLRSRVDRYFRDNNLTRYATPAMHLKTAILLTLYFGSYALMLSNWFRSWDLFAFQMVFHFTMFMISVGIAHDGSHQAYSPRKWVNRAVEFAFDLIGINSHFWTYAHVHAHHNGPNVPLYDSAIESFAFVRLHPKTPGVKISRYQHIYMLFIYAIAPFFMVFVLEFVSFIQQVAGFKKDDEHSPGQIAFMVLSKFIVLGYTLVIPLMVINVPAWQIIWGFVVGHLMTGICLGIVFEPTHLHEHTVFPEPDERGYMGHSYAMHIMKTTSSFSVNNPVVTWISGGLNIHTTHHLLPEICQIHLPKLVPIVRETAKEFGITYWEYSFFDAIRSHLRLLKRVGETPSWDPRPVESVPADAAEMITSLQ